MYNRKVYDPEFKLNVVKEYLNGDKSQAQICEEYSISHSMFFKWLRNFSDEEMLIHLECNHHDIAHGITSLRYNMINGYIVGHKELTCVVSQGSKNNTLVYLFDGSLEYDYEFPIEVNILNVDEVSSVLWDNPWQFVTEICYYD